MTLAEYLGRVRGVVADPERIVVTNGYSQGLASSAGLVAAGAQADRGGESEHARRPGDRRAHGPRDRADRRRRGGHPGRRARAGRAGRRDRHARASAADRRRAQRRSPHRLDRLAARAHVRSRSRTTTTPSTATTAPRSVRCRVSRRTSRLRRLDEQDARAGAAPRLARAAAAAARAPSRTRSSSPTAAPRASSSTRSPTSSRAASSTGTCAACASATASSATHSSRRSREELPGGTVTGIAAGLHVTAQLPGDRRRAGDPAEAVRRGVVLRHDERLPLGRPGGPPTLMLGYGRVPEPAIVPGVHEIAEAVRGNSQLRGVGIAEMLPAGGPIAADFSPLFRKTKAPGRT